MRTSKTGKKKGKIGIVVLIILGVILLAAAIPFFADAPGRQELKKLTIGSVDFTKLQDGTYVGEYKGTKGKARNAAVKVTVSDGKIAAIKILKGALDSHGKPAELTGGMTIEDLFKRVIESDSLQVDAISGATLTSKAHLKALENALKQSLKE
jgi:uncharacterized protein with FMN-binding domain